jgi:hypothetical protein
MKTIGQLLLLTLSVTFGCSSEGNVAPQALELDAPCAVAGAAATSSVPTAEDEPSTLADEVLLCRLEIGVSTPEDAKAVLGKPDQASDNGTSATLGYFGPDGVTLFLGFAGYILTAATIDNAPFPRCWTEQLAARGGPDPEF